MTTTDAVDRGAEAEELARLRAEVSTLRTQLDTRQRRSFALLALRRVVAAVLVVVAAFGLVASVVGLWAARTTLDTDRWVATVAPLPQDPRISAAVADYATAQLSEVLNIEQRLRVVLPPQAGFVVGPLADQVRQAVEKAIDRVLRSDEFQQIWTELNRRAHQRALAILEGRSDVVLARDDRVEIDLLPLINEALRDLSTRLPTLFGRQLSLPDISSGEIPANLRTRISEELGVTLPANFAQFTIYDAGRLRAIQLAVERFKRDLALLWLATIVAFVLALVVSPGRRRTVLQFGLWLVVAAVAVTAVARGIRNEVLSQVPDGVYRDGVEAAMISIFATLRERGQQLAWLGVALAVIAYLVGPGRLPVRLRGYVARGTRAGARGAGRGAGAVARHAPGWIAQHLDAVRIAGVVVAVLLALIFSSWTSLLVLVLALAAFEILVTLVARARPAAPDPPVPPAQPLAPAPSDPPAQLTSQEEGRTVGSGA
jgi:hypothetical protein